ARKFNAVLGQILLPGDCLSEGKRDIWRVLGVDAQRIPEIIKKHPACSQNVNLVGGQPPEQGFHCHTRENCVAPHHYPAICHPTDVGKRQRGCCTAEIDLEDDVWDHQCSEERCVIG